MKVQIEMETFQTVEGETQVLRHQAMGLRRNEEKEIVVSYVLDDIRQELHIDPERQQVAVIRNRRQDNPILYQRGLHHVMEYETAAGVLELGFRTEELRILVDPGTQCVNILLVYAMTQLGETAADCELRIHIRPAEKTSGRDSGDSITT